MDPAAAPSLPQINGSTKPTTAKHQQVDISGRVYPLIADLSGLDLTEIKNDTDLPNIGIDSLMSTEMARDIEKVVNHSLDATELNEVVDVQSLIK
jgi:acyl carrier protein